MSREGTITSTTGANTAQVRLRQNQRIQRKPRPTSIAVSGMSQSMYDKRPTSTSSAASTPLSSRGPPRCEILSLEMNSQFLSIISLYLEVTIKISIFYINCDRFSICVILNHCVL